MVETNGRETQFKEAKKTRLLHPEEGDDVGMSYSVLSKVNGNSTNSQNELAPNKVRKWIDVSNHAAEPKRKLRCKPQPSVTGQEFDADARKSRNDPDCAVDYQNR
jgi:hypothetical protein